METTTSQPYNGFGSSTQSVRRIVVLPSNQTLRVTSRGRAHTISIEVLSDAQEAGQAEVHLSSRLVEGSMPHQGIDETLTMAGHRLRVRSSGRAHTVVLKEGWVEE